MTQRTDLHYKKRTAESTTCRSKPTRTARVNVQLRHWTAKHNSEQL